MNIFKTLNKENSNLTKEDTDQKANVLSVKEQPKNQESEVHMGKYWKSFLEAVKNRQKHVNTRRFIYYSIYGKNPERQKLRGSATFGAATERGVSVCTACSATGWGSPLLILDIR